MRIRFVLFLLLFLVGSQVCFAEVTKDDFTVDGVNLFASKYEDVLAQLGKPYKEKVEEQGQPAYTYLTYPGLSLWTVNETKKLVYMKIEGYERHTKRGVTIGGTAHKIIKEYGQPQKQSLRGHMYYVYTLHGDVKGRLLFDMTDGYVGNIIFSALPNVP